MAQAPAPRDRRDVATADLIGELKLETICESGKCPNRSECWTRKTATFMVLGETCTRPCGFCAVPRGKPEAVALDEPDRLAEACFRLGLKHVVITSVTRDDLADGGADHFRRCVVAVRARTGATIEVLTPDFDGDLTAIDTVLSASPEVFNHNLETVARLQRHVRRKSQYAVSLAVLAHAKRSRPDLRTKSGLMLGLGETTEEVFEALADLRAAGVRPADDGAVFAAFDQAPARRAVLCPPRSSTSWGGWRGPWGFWRWRAGRSCGRAITRMRWRRVRSGDGEPGGEPRP